MATFARLGAAQFKYTPTFETLADAAAAGFSAADYANMPSPMTTCVLRYDDGSPVAMVPYEQAESEPSHSLKYQDGAVWFEGKPLFAFISMFGASPSVSAPSPEQLAANTAAMARAIVFVGSGGTIFFGAGDWYFDDFDLPSQRHFVGAGRDETRFIYGGTGGVMVTATGSIGGSSWKNMRITSAALDTSLTSETFLKAYVSGSNRDLFFEHVWIERFSNIGLDLSDVYNLNCTNVRFNRNGNATTNGGAIALSQIIFVSGSITSGVFINCHFGTNHRTIYATDPTKFQRWISFFGTVFESNTNLPELGVSESIKYINPYFEANTNPNTPQGFSIDGGANVEQMLPLTPISGTARIDWYAASTASNCYYQLVSGTAGVAGIRFGDTAGVGQGAVLYDNSSDTMTLRTNAALAWRVLPSGDFLPGVDDTQVIGRDTLRINQVFTGAGLVSKVAIALNAAGTGLFNPANDGVAVAAAGVTTATFRTDHSFWLNTATNNVHSGTTPGFVVSGTTNGQTRIGVSGSAPLQVNRITDDGNVIEINQDGTTEGAISVAGTTVTYGSFCGVHWTQIAGAGDLLPGTVLESIDEMAEWLALELPDGRRIEDVPAAKVGDSLPYTDRQDVTVTKTGDMTVVDERSGDETVLAMQMPNGGLRADLVPEGAALGETYPWTWEEVEEQEVTVHGTVVLLDNDQLPRAKVSDRAASPCVYGVVMSNEKTEVNSASIGAYLVRIAKGVKVKNGDLLESDGKGCARVQPDDIVRSKTIGKVTAAVVRETYKDGSYLVPCVLYCG